jgi:hypothetical protein
MLRTATSIASLVLETRRELSVTDLGAFGPSAIRQALLQQEVADVPSLRTIYRILADSSKRVVRRAKFSSGFRTIPGRRAVCDGETCLANCPRMATVGIQRGKCLTLQSFFVRIHNV